MRSRNCAPLRTVARWSALVGLLGALDACSGRDEPALSELAQQGELVYQNICVACHNGNPNLDGAVGPANAGASEELLAAKILRGEYPSSYTPKRPGVAMPRFEYLAEKIPALTAYLKETQTADAP